MTVNVRYIVEDVDAAVAFYRDHLGLAVEMMPGRVSRYSPARGVCGCC